MGEPARKLSDEERRRALAWVAYEKRFNKLAYFEPYEKQQRFFDMGYTVRERLLMAGNQVGKTECGAFEAACHATGRYPRNWKGRRFDQPVRCWIAGETSTVVRDVQQKKLCGEPGVDSDFGSGFIPKDCFVDKPSLARGVTDAYDTVQVRHVTGGVSVLRFKSYEQGRAKFQGETLHFVWFDEEPPLDIYTEGLTRTNASDGFVYMTFTPLRGVSAVVLRFLNEQDDARDYITMTIDDARHITRPMRDQIIASYPPHEREARTMGIPMLGSGRIFQTPEATIREPRIERVPIHWAKIWGIDFGIAHPFAAVLLLWDRDNDVLHVHHTVRMADSLPLQCAVPMKVVGADVPVAWPHDGNIRGDRGTGQTMATLFGAQGLRMLGVHATWSDGGFSTEAGITEISERLATGRMKVADHLSDFFEEYRLYHRKEGQIVKEHDDILSALRIAVMMKRYAKDGPLGSKRARDSEPKRKVARDVDFDVFGPFSDDDPFQ